MRITIFIFFIAFSIISCSKEKPVKDPYLIEPIGFGTAKVNGEVHDFKPFLYHRNNQEYYGLSLNRYLNERLRSEIHIAHFYNTSNLQILTPEIIGEDHLKPEASYGTRLSSCELLMGNYYFLNDNDEIDDYVQLISFDENSGDMVGKFQCSFVVDTSTICDKSSPDTIVITDGYFETTVLKM